MLLAIALVFLVQDAVGLEAVTAPRIEDLAARREADRVLVSFRVAGAFTEETLDRVQSGIPVTFKYRMRVVAKRGFPLMPAKEIGRTRVDAKVVYDALTGQYSLSRTVNHRRKKSGEPPKTLQNSTSSEAEMRRWMTDLVDVPILDPDPDATDPLTGAKLRVRVESNLGRKFVWLVFPTTRGDSAEIPFGP